MSVVYFAFGQVYSDNSAYFAEIFDSSNIAARPTFSFSTAEPGLGLTRELFLNAKELLKIVTRGFIVCPTNNTAFCVLPGSCSNYPNVLKN